MPKSNILEESRGLKMNFLDLLNVVVIGTLDDGNCFFHSILRAFNNDYINAKTIADRVNLARTFRNALAERLDEIEPISGKNYYETLNKGKLKEISQGIKEYTKESLQMELRSSVFVDNMYQELISNALHLDIFIIDGNKKDMLNIGDAFDTYFKGRNSVVLYYTHGHYEVVGVKHSDGSVDTIFTPNHPLIQGCREKIIFNIRPNVSSPKYKTSPKVSKTSPK
jgi:hypothetical protein